MGKGMVIAGKTLAEALEQLGILPDFDRYEPIATHKPDPSTDPRHSVFSRTEFLRDRSVGLRPRLQSLADSAQSCERDRQG